MPPALELGLIVCLVALLAVSAGATGALWWRAGSRPGDELARLADEVAALRRGVEALLAQQHQEPAMARPSAGQKAVRRVDRAEPSAGSAPTPTLIAVPSLASGQPEPSPASAELGRRFGAIWALADAGASAEA